MRQRASGENSTRLALPNPAAFWRKGFWEGRGGGKGREPALLQNSPACLLPPARAPIILCTRRHARTCARPLCLVFKRLGLVSPSRLFNTHFLSLSNSQFVFASLLSSFSSPLCARARAARVKPSVGGLSPSSFLPPTHTVSLIWLRARSPGSNLRGGVPLSLPPNNTNKSAAATKKPNQQSYRPLALPLCLPLPLPASSSSSPKKHRQ